LFSDIQAKHFSALRGFERFFFCNVLPVFSITKQTVLVWSQIMG
jgi:hypothetical protein